jgi:uncharacterized membrane protein
MTPTVPPPKTRSVWIWIQALFFMGAGAAHFLVPAPYIAMMPRGLPRPGALVAISGAAEMAGGLGLLLPFTRTAAAGCPIALRLAVFPANLNVALHGWPGMGVPAWVLWLRLPFQAVFIAWVYALSLRVESSPAAPKPGA